MVTLVPKTGTVTASCRRGRELICKMQDVTPCEASSKGVDKVLDQVATAAARLLVGFGFRDTDAALVEDKAELLCPH